MYIARKENGKATNERKEWEMLCLSGPRTVLGAICNKIYRRKNDKSKDEGSKK